MSIDFFSSTPLKIDFREPRFHPHYNLQLYCIYYIYYIYIAVFAVHCSIGILQLCVGALSLV